MFYLSYILLWHYRCFICFIHLMSNVFDVLNLTCSTCCTKMYYIIHKMAYSTVCNKGRPSQKIFSWIYHWLDFKNCSHSPDGHEFIKTCKAMKEHCLWSGNLGSMWVLSFVTCALTWANLLCTGGLINQSSSTYAFILKIKGCVSKGIGSGQSSTSQSVHIFRCWE